jgi:hypothetical protein
MARKNQVGNWGRKTKPTQGASVNTPRHCSEMFFYFLRLLTARQAVDISQVNTIICNARSRTLPVCTSDLHCFSISNLEEKNDLRSFIEGKKHRHWNLWHSHNDLIGKHLWICTVRRFINQQFLHVVADRKQRSVVFL